MRDEPLIRRFEGGLVQPATFHHADHVRLAYAYLSEFPALVALEKFCEALKRFADARGKPRLYNETITFAYFFLIRERMARSGVGSWQAFADANPDLFERKNGILKRYYTEAALSSEFAREVYVLPDRCLLAAESLEVASHER